MSATITLKHCRLIAISIYNAEYQSIEISMFVSLCPVSKNNAVFVGFNSVVKKLDALMPRISGTTITLKCG